MTKLCLYCGKPDADRKFESRHNPASVIWVHTNCIPGLNKLIPLHTHKGN